MERSPNIPQQEEKEEQMKVSESPKKAIFYIHHPVHFLQQLLRYMFKCLGFHEISITNNDDQSKGLNPLPGGADYSDGYNNPSEQDGVVPSSASQQASDPPPSTTTNQQVGASELLARRRPQRPGPTQGPGPQTN